MYASLSTIFHVERNNVPAKMLCHWIAHHWCTTMPAGHIANLGLGQPPYCYTVKSTSSIHERPSFSLGRPRTLAYTFDHSKRKEAGLAQLVYCLLHMFPGHFQTHHQTPRRSTSHMSSSFPQNREDSYGMLDVEQMLIISQTCFPVRQYM